MENEIKIWVERSLYWTEQARMALRKNDRDACQRIAERYENLIRLGRGGAQNHVFRAILRSDPKHPR